MTETVPIDQSHQAVTAFTGRTGFIGLGNMGSRIAACIVRAGIDVLGYDTRSDTPESCGATPAPSIAHVVENSDVIFLSLPESRIVERVIRGEDGIAAHARPGQVVVDLSTSSPASTRELHALLADRGAVLLDAGISGGAAAASRGALTLMVGGSRTALTSIRPLLDTFSRHVFVCGDIGAGHTAKLLNNFLNAIALSATAEVMVAGRKAGLNLEVLLEVLNNSSGVNFATLNRFPHIIHGDYLEGGLTNALMMKDVVAYVDLAAELGVASPNSAAPLAAFGLAERLGYSDRISNTVVDAIGDVSGRVRLHEPGRGDDSDRADTREGNGSKK
ncbi:NAD(P)-dependent oxidoreductase [Rhodococcus sp. NCIMB 12038]|uniref:NAD(P)-dependent oxidoreductase n=1 Tax=Rhodococcus sp. NCIMB 12038 TaxID=933800 RepID=UPI000B3D17D8|nr:NAD(P)-dependent oxidoreductase [Rhodococcus sp. NCIMB 12038]OUS91373.1 3-hydroxyisobutyrate dehydrogenase [Rhodococcus sp. NCIMB 12038]